MSLVICVSINPSPPPLITNTTTPLLLSHKSSFPSLISTKSKSLISRLSSSPNPPDSDEFKWLREEQRWLREEQRWLREEQRWIHKRESFLIEIAELKLKIQALEKNRSILISAEERADSVAGVMKVLKNKNLIAAPETSEKEESEVVKVVDEGRSKDVEDNVKTTTAKKTKGKTLRKWSEGEDVKILQEALEKLGFYSGEEDTEYSIFSSGTERAVKTWQATIGESEDGIMTSELLEKLYTEQHIEVSGKVVNLEQEGSLTISQRGSLNGAAIASVSETSEIKQTVVKKDVNRDDTSENRVFLLGENRWEDPSRLGGGKKNIIGSKTETAKIQCTTCHGEGRILCIECDGTGEPNIEEQFMEWVERTKCPYCEGLGFTACDVCQEKTVT